MKLPSRIKHAIEYNKFCGLPGGTISEAIFAYYKGDMIGWHKVGQKALEQFDLWIVYNGLECDGLTKEELNPLGL